MCLRPEIDITRVRTRVRSYFQMAMRFRQRRADPSLTPRSAGAFACAGTHWQRAALALLGAFAFAVIGPNDSGPARAASPARAATGSTGSTGGPACASHALANPSGATVYYVSPSGSDANTGTSPCAAWQTMVNPDSTALAPGDIIAFEGRQTFGLAADGQAYDSVLRPPPETGTAAAPIIYTSYGSGQAALTYGIYLKSSSYIDITDLDVSSSVTAAVYASGSDPAVGDDGGTGATNILIEGDNITDTYDSEAGGFGISIVNPANTGWVIKDDNIENTADSGIFGMVGVVVENSVLADNGIGQHCGWPPGGPPATLANHPCHAIYAKSGGWTITGNTFSYDGASAQYSGISLRGPDNFVADNNISGDAESAAAINYGEESTTAGTTSIIGNTISGDSEAGIAVYGSDPAVGDAAAEPLVESFVIADNTVSGPADYDLYLASPTIPTATAVNSGNDFGANPAAGGKDAYIDVAYPVAYTSSTYSESGDTFSGSTNPTPSYINDSGRTQAAYECWFSLGPCPSPPGKEGTGGTGATGVQPHAPISLHAPAISIKRGVLRASTGKWKGAGIVYSYQWQIRARAHARGQSQSAHHTFKDIAGATRPTLKEARLRVGAVVRVCVRAHDASGSSTRCSATVVTKRTAK